MNKGLHSLCQVISQLNVVGIIFPIFQRSNLGFRTLKQCFPITAIPRGRENQSWKPGKAFSKDQAFIFSTVKFLSEIGFDVLPKMDVYWVPTMFQALC